MKSFCLEHFLAERHSPVLFLLFSSSSSSLFSLFCLMQLICRSCVSIRDEPREPVCKGLFPSSGEPGERPVRATWAKEKQQMSNYPCSAAHGGSDPVGKSVFIFPKFHILFTGRSDTEKVCHRVFWGGYFIRVHYNPVWCHPSTLQLPAERKESEAVAARDGCTID